MNPAARRTTNADVGLRGSMPQNTECELEEGGNWKIIGINEAIEIEKKDRHIRCLRCKEPVRAHPEEWQANSPFRALYVQSSLPTQVEASDLNCQNSSDDCTGERLRNERLLAGFRDRHKLFATRRTANPLIVQPHQINWRNGIPAFGADGLQRIPNFVDIGSGAPGHVAVSVRREPPPELLAKWDSGNFLRAASASCVTASSMLGAFPSAA